ncbi:MAG: hypothetical protein K6A44_05650 [bacterium]|nr:hypothetical protein [bacterium]
MAYKNDSYLVIANKFGTASSDAKAELFQLYDQIRDISVNGSTYSGSGFEGVANWIINVSRLIAPSAYAPLYGYSVNVPGTSYSTAVSGGNAVYSSGTSAFGLSNLSSYNGFSTGYAADLGNLTGLAASITDGVETGYAASMVDWLPNAASAAAGMYAGFGGTGTNFVIPLAGFVSGVGGIATALSPYMGVYGLGATLAGNIMQGYGSAVLAGYQNISGRILANADSVMTNKVRNIETVAKMLDTQGDIVRKMLKDEIEGDQKQVENIGS